VSRWQDKPVRYGWDTPLWGRPRQRYAYGKALRGSCTSEGVALVILGEGRCELWAFVEREETGGEQRLQFFELEVRGGEVSCLDCEGTHRVGDGRKDVCVI
jgi:hypothetical protein